MIRRGLERTCIACVLQTPSCLVLMYPLSRQKPRYMAYFSDKRPCCVSFSYKIYNSVTRWKAAGGMASGNGVYEKSNGHPTLCNAVRKLIKAQDPMPA